jgi:hypothetical protein
MREYIYNDSIENTKRICIIGANGYIGSRLLDFLLFRTDYHITILSPKFHKFNILPSERLVVVTGNQDNLPDEFYNTFSSIITFAPFSRNLVSKINDEQVFIFTDPRYQRMTTNLHYYYIDSAQINGFSPSFDTTKTINKEVFLFKSGLKAEIEQIETSFISIFDFCRFIETVLIYNQTSFSGRYFITSETMQYFPFEFISYDTYNTIIGDILTNWNRIENIKTGYNCMICQSESLTAKNNPDFVYCTYCFHIQKKTMDIITEPKDIFSETFSEYTLIEHANYFSGIHNLLIVTPWNLKECQKTFLRILIEGISQRELKMEFISLSEIKNVYSLFDIVLLPYGIENILNPTVLFSNLLEKLFDNGKIIVQTKNTLPFVTRYNFDNISIGQSFYNTSSMKGLCNKTGLKLINSHYSRDINLNTFICYKNTGNFEENLVDTFLFELESEVYDEKSY